jgi:hypothetical protein
MVGVAVIKSIRLDLSKVILSAIQGLGFQKAVGNLQGRRVGHL